MKLVRRMVVAWSTDRTSSGRLKAIVNMTGHTGIVLGQGQALPGAGLRGFCA
jgi:hypothetical protein